MVRVASILGYNMMWLECRTACQWAWEYWFRQQPSTTQPMVHNTPQPAAAPYTQICAATCHIIWMYVIGNLPYMTEPHCPQHTAGCSTLLHQQ